MPAVAFLERPNGFVLSALLQLIGGVDIGGFRNVRGKESFISAFESTSRCFERLPVFDEPSFVRFFLDENPIRGMSATGDHLNKDKHPICFARLSLYDVVEAYFVNVKGDVVQSEKIWL